MMGEPLLRTTGAYLSDEDASVESEDETIDVLTPLDPASDPKRTAEKARPETGATSEREAQARVDETLQAWLGSALDYGAGGTPPPAAAPSAAAGAPSPAASSKTGANASGSDWPRKWQADMPIPAAALEDGEPVAEGSQQLAVQIARLKAEAVRLSKAGDPNAAVAKLREAKRIQNQLNIRRYEVHVRC